MSTPPTRERRLVGVSTKMYFSAARTASYISTLKSLLPPPLLSDVFTKVDIFVIPDHITIIPTISQLSSTPPSPHDIWVGAQDAHHASSGAFTGEVSPAVLAEVGCKIVELGHAERRRYFGEGDLEAARKARAAAKEGLVPLVCIGEVTRPNDPKDAVREVRVQVESLVKGAGWLLKKQQGEESEVTEEEDKEGGGLPDDADLILAYEPVWAIGAQEPAGADHVVAVAKGIRDMDVVKERKGRTRILYGGSAGPGLFEKLKDGVDGLFLGRFAHDPERFVQTIKEVGEA